VLQEKVQGKIISGRGENARCPLSEALERKGSPRESTAVIQNERLVPGKGRFREGKMVPSEMKLSSPELGGCFSRREQKREKCCPSEKEKKSENKKESVLDVEEESK